MDEDRDFFKALDSVIEENDIASVVQRKEMENKRRLEQEEECRKEKSLQNELLENRKKQWENYVEWRFKKEQWKVISATDSLRTKFTMREKYLEAQVWYVKLILRVSC